MSTTEQSGGGEVASKRAKPPGEDAGAGGEDRLSALHDDILVLILPRLDFTTRFAARTSILSRRWRHVWTLLPDLCFPPAHHPDCDCLRSILSASEVPLRNLLVAEPDASPESLAVWLPVAARRVSGELILSNSITVRTAKDREEAEASQTGTFELLCFQKATSICLGLGFLGLTVPPAGVFARLIDLDLSHFRFHGPGELGDVVSSPRCPCLQKLTIHNVWGLENVTINSESLQLLELKKVHGVRQVTVVAPALKELSVSYCFIIENSQPVADITASQLTLLRWADAYDPSSVHLGSMENLETLDVFFSVYGLDVFPHNRACLMLLPQFKAIENLVLSLGYVQEIHYLQYLMEDITMLPEITSLELNVMATGHAFGASLFLLLRIYSTIKRLTLVLSSNPDYEEDTVCSSYCICRQPTNWKTEELLLNHLQELEIEGFRGSGHEIALLKPLFNWVTVLKMMSVTFSRSVTESKAKELFQMFKSFSSPGVSVKFYLKNFRKVPYAPEG